MSEVRPPDHLPELSQSFLEESQKLADEFSVRGTVQHFAFRCGFMPYDEAAAEAILKRCLQELDWYRNRANQ